MNIFASSPCPEKCAQYLDDKRVVKMVLESAQMLSTAIVCRSSYDLAPYKPTHINHPCTVWVRRNHFNYLWMLNHFKALCKEYTRRFKKRHKCEDYVLTFSRGIMFMRLGEGQTPFPNCTDIKDNMINVHDAYKSYLKNKWINDKRTPTWR